MQRLHAEADERDGYTQGQRNDSARVDSFAVVIRALAMIEGVYVELGVADEEVIADHDAGNGTQQPGVANQPAEDVRVGRREEFPRTHREAEEARDEPTGTKTDQSRIQVGEVVRRRDNIGPDVDVERGNENGDERDEGYKRLMERTDQHDRIPDGMAEEHDGGRRDR